MRLEEAQEIKRRMLDRLHVASDLAGQLCTWFGQQGNHDRVEVVLPDSDRQMTLYGDRLLGLQQSEETIRLEVGLGATGKKLVVTLETTWDEPMA